MKKAVWSGIIAGIGILALSTPVFAQAASDSANVTVAVTVNARAKLSLGTTAISFVDADPDTTPVINATAMSVDVKARTSATGVVALTVQSGGNLTPATSGAPSIAISNLKWTATGTSFVSGTSSTSAVSVGSWTGSGNRTGTQTYTLDNSWTYATGSYSATLTYTLVAP